jgi:hypothetical protein
MHTFILSKLATAVTLGTVILGGATLVAPTASSSQTAGSTRFFTTAGPENSIVFTGVIGNYGKSISVNKEGKSDPNGRYEKVSLVDGSFELKAGILDAAVDKAQPNMNQMTCSGWFSATEPVTLFDGTGRYRGVNGTLRTTATIAFVLSRQVSGKDKGQCNTTGRPLSSYSLIEGSGKVSF